MKIAITSQNKKSVTGHAGKCTRFWLYDLSEEQQLISKEMVELPMDQSFHSNSHGIPVGLEGIEVLITGGMGSGLIKKLMEMGIQPIITDKTDIEQAVQSFLQQEPSVPVSQCNCHGHESVGDNPI
ncbi:MAG: nitrogen fixation protein [Magnetococcus sp. THC-1_WYH]